MMVGARRRAPEGARLSGAIDLLLQLLLQTGAGTPEFRETLRIGNEYGSASHEDDARCAPVQGSREYDT